MKPQKITNDSPEFTSGRPAPLGRNLQPGRCLTHPVVLNLLLACLLLCSAPNISQANAWYNDDSSLNFSRPDWMGKLTNSLLISELAIPGTHDTMALGDWNQPSAAQCQSVSLNGLLNAGIRALDIRCRHINDSFAIHHGPFYQHANFTDVMNACSDFLSDHPAEVILMKVQDEYEDSGNSRTFQQTLMDYLDNYPTNLIWETENYLVMPSLGEVRGKIVLMDNWPDEGDGQLGIPWGEGVDNQDEYSIHHSRAAFDDKWEAIKDQLIAARSGSAELLYGNFTSANMPDSPNVDDLLITPGKVAGGMYIIEWEFNDEFPYAHRRSGYEDGMNERTYRYLRSKIRDDELWRTGMIMMDYPGRGLIDVIIAHNGLGMDLANDPPVADAGGAYFVDECSTVLLDGSGSFDFDGDTLSYSWDFYSDGTWDIPWTNEPYALFEVGDNMDTNVTLAVWDGTISQEGMDDDIAPMIIQNVAPVVSIDGMKSMINDCIMPGHTVTFSGSFIDPGYMDTHTAEWDFDEGTVYSGDLTEENDKPESTGFSECEYTYDEAGTYTVIFSVTDDDGGIGRTECQVLVRTPAQVCQFMEEYIQSLPKEVFSVPARQHQKTFSNKLQAVERAVQVGHSKGPSRKLLNDLRKKWDGSIDGNSKGDWLIDTEAQALLCLTVDELIKYLED